MLAKRQTSPPGRSGFTMAEMLVVMAIITVLAASLVIIVPKLRTRAMVAAAGSDIQQLSMVLEQVNEDMGRYPSKPYTPPDPDNPRPEDYIDHVLYKTLTDPNWPQTGTGWGGARTDWKFIRGDAVDQEHFLDPWGVPYYYIPWTDYLLGVRVDDPTDTTPLKTSSGAALPNCFGATPADNDFRGPSDEERRFPPAGYFGPPPRRDVFFNATTFQIHSKGPDQKTDAYDDKPDVVDACDRGTDPDDINNYGGHKR